jgi:hypothetical protein
MLSAETEAAGCIDTDACVNATRWRHQSCRDITGNAVFACTEFPRKLGSNTDQLTISHVICRAWFHRHKWHHGAGRVQWRLGTDCYCWNRSLPSSRNSGCAAQNHRAKAIVSDEASASHDVGWSENGRATRSAGTATRAAGKRMTLPHASGRLAYRQILVPVIGSIWQWPPGFSSLESQKPVAHAAQAARGRPPCVAQYSRRLGQFSHLGIAGTTPPDRPAAVGPPRYRPRVARSERSAPNPGMFIAVSPLASCQKNSVDRVRGSSPFRQLPASSVEVGRQLGDQERKLLGDVDSREELFGVVGVAVGVREDHIDDVAGRAQG